MTVEVFQKARELTSAIGDMQEEINSWNCNSGSLLDDRVRQLLPMYIRDDQVRLRLKFVLEKAVRDFGEARITELKEQLEKLLSELYAL